eukprot:6612479-Prymnesium_polylepis.1
MTRAARLIAREPFPARGGLLLAVQKSLREQHAAFECDDGAAGHFVSCVLSSRPLDTHIGFDSLPHTVRIHDRDVTL